MSIALPKQLLCPFCGAKIARPGPVNRPSYADSDGGGCVCGAWYAVDHTSHNLGQAMLDAYCFATGSLDGALDLNPDEDLDEKIIEAYDAKSHKVMPKKSPHFAGASLYFVRLRPEARARFEND